MEHCMLLHGVLHASSDLPRCSEQVREEGPAKVSLVEDETHNANHGNAASGHLKLQGQGNTAETEDNGRLRSSQ